MFSVALIVFVSIFSCSDTTTPRPMSEKQQARFNEQLWQAAYFGNLPAIRLWLSQGAQTTFKGPAGTTPLMIAANNNRTEAVILLLDSGADVNAKDFWGNTALVRASSSPDTVAVLLERGAHWTQPDWKGDFPLLNAAFIGATRTVQLLLDKGAVVNVRNTKNGWNALMNAALNNHAETARLLVSRGADLEAVDWLDGRTALARASENGHFETVKVLLEAKADPNHVDSKALTPLMLASRFRRDRVVALLIQNGAKVDEKDPADGRTALMFAAASGSNRTVLALLNSSADLNLKDSVRGWSALDYAIRDGDSVETVRMLLEKGSTLNQTDLKGQTPLHGAASVGTVQMLRAVLNASNSSLVIDKKDINGITPLMNAASSGSLAKVEMLLDAGAAINETSVDGMTALMYATRRGVPQTVAHLLESGADVNAKRSGDGFTAVMIAVDAGKTEILRVLVAQRGVDLTLRDAKNMTAIELAAVKDYRCMVETLLAAQPGLTMYADPMSGGFITQNLPCIRDYEY